MSPSPTSRFEMDGAPDTRKDFFLVCPNALAASTGCKVLADMWFRRVHFSICAWTLSPLAPANWLTCPDKFRSSATNAVQDTLRSLFSPLSSTSFAVSVRMWIALGAFLMLTGRLGDPAHRVTPFF